MWQTLYHLDGVIFDLVVSDQKLIYSVMHDTNFQARSCIDAVTKCIF